MSGSIYTTPTTGSMMRRAGVVSATIDGEAIDVAGDCTYDATRFKREVLEGQSGPQGFSETLKYGSISFSVRDAGNLSQERIMEMVNVPIVVVTATGKTVSGDQMTCIECGEVKTAEGTFDTKWAGYVVESSY